MVFMKHYILETLQHLKNVHITQITYMVEENKTKI